MPIGNPNGLAHAPRGSMDAATVAAPAYPAPTSKVRLEIEPIIPPPSLPRSANSISKKIPYQQTCHPEQSEGPASPRQCLNSDHHALPTYGVCGASSTSETSPFFR